jgi:phosphatidylglycerophosphatase A
MAFRGFGATLLRLLATWFGLGFLPAAPGTFGALGAVPLLIGQRMFGAASQAALLAGLILTAIAAAGAYAARAGRADPPEVVIDEAAGMALTLFLVPLNLWTLSGGFLLFRLFDILKPFPVRSLERLPGGWGIVFDDLCAGLYAQACLRAAICWIR